MQVPPHTTPHASRQIPFRMSPSHPYRDRATEDIFSVMLCCPLSTVPRNLLPPSCPPTFLLRPFWSRHPPSVFWSSVPSPKFIFLQMETFLRDNDKGSPFGQLPLSWVPLVLAGKSIFLVSAQSHCDKEFGGFDWLSPSDKGKSLE